MSHLSEQASPFNDNPVNVSWPQHIGDPSLFFSLILVNGSHHLFGPRAVFWRNSIFQITGDGLKAIALVTNHCQASAPAVVLAAKAKSGIKIRQIVNEFLQRIAFLFERRGNGQPVALREETHDASAAGGNPIWLNKAEPPP